MSELRTAAQQALEALESLFTLQADDARPKRCGDAITALKAALEQPDRAQRMRDAGYTRRPTLREMADPEQPEQEPVAIRHEWQPCVKLPVTVHVREQRPGESHVSTREGITPIRPDDLIMRGVAGEEYPIGRELFERTYRLGTHPPRREWRGLTEEEIIDAVRESDLDWYQGWTLEYGTPNRYAQLARAIEAALKERNA